MKRAEKYAFNEVPEWDGKKYSPFYEAWANAYDAFVKMFQYHNDKTKK